MLCVPCAAITLWINISVKRHKWHHKINPINIIFWVFCFFFCISSMWVAQYCGVGKRQIDQQKWRKKERLNRSEFLYKITTEKTNSTWYSRTLMAMRLLCAILSLWANTASHKLEHISLILQHQHKNLCHPIGFRYIPKCACGPAKIICQPKKESSSQFFRQHTHTHTKQHWNSHFCRSLQVDTVHISLFSHVLK